MKFDERNRTKARGTAASSRRREISREIVYNLIVSRDATLIANVRLKRIYGTERLLPRTIIGVYELSRSSLTEAKSYYHADFYCTLEIFTIYNPNIDFNLQQ